MKKYYLDTVAVRSLGKVLLNSVGCCFTSVFTVFELLSGISLEEYEIRKSTIINLYNSKMEIDLRMPVEIILESFKIMEQLPGITSADIEVIAKELTMSVNYNDFIERNKKLKPNIYLLKYFDQKLSAEFKRTFLKKTSDIRNERTIEKKASMQPIKEKGLDALSTFICQKLLPNNFGQSEHVRKRYDGSIDRFLDAWLGYYRVNANLLNEPSRNDWADILHTTYLDQTGDIVFVTNEKKLKASLMRLYLVRQ